MIGQDLQNSDWKNGFLFLGNQITLDFLNTRPVQDGEPTELIPDFDSLLRWFEAAGLLGPREASALRRQWGSSPKARKCLQAIRELREHLREEILLWEHGKTVRDTTLDRLNRLLAEHPMRIEILRADKVLELALRFHPKTPEDLFAPLVHGAATLFATVDQARVRKCDACVLHFLDTSKKGTRRWCSMQFCGNRSKVAAYAARQRDSHE